MRGSMRRTMPGVKDDKKTKYVKDGNLASGKYYDLLQYKSGKGQKPVDGYIADKRVMEGGKALTDAIGADGEPIRTLPRGFYLKASFTANLLQQQFALPSS